ncbi:MAG: T9SS type A sorting domain-containing protein [Bacteroidota bacterium]
MKFRLIFSAVLFFLCTGGAFAQPVLSVSIHIPTITVNQAAESYDPMPIPVTVTIYNTGTTASLALSTRISVPPDLELDPSEFGAVIKSPVPVAVQPNDSVKVTWNLTHPASFTMINYRVRVWLVYTPADSFETQKLFLLPAMDPPDFKMTFTGLPTLQVRPDSLGYQQNPFPLSLRLANQGGTTVDSVTVHVFLPPDYMFDPPTQANPIVYGLPIFPPKPGNPRIDLDWEIRYVGATRNPRTDTLRFRVAGKDIAGGTVQKDTLLLINVDGLSPRYSISFLDPGVMQYDTATIYSPQPYPLQLRIENVSEQWIDLAGLSLTIQGEGVATQDPLTYPLPMLLTGGHLDFQWNVAAERRSLQRQFTAMIEVADGDGRVESGTHAVSIPGQPYSLTVQDFQTVDTLAINAEGTAFLTNAIPLSFRLRNDAWYNSRVIASRVQSQGQGILPPPFKDRQHSFFLKPADVTPVIPDTFFVQGQVGSRSVSFLITALSDRGDTARASRTVVVPGLLPVMRLTHRGPDHILPDYLGGYAPNPMAQEYVLHNDGNIDFRIDSVVLRFPMDGVVTPEPLRRDYGWMLRPGDTLLTRWNFSLYARDSSRLVPMSVTAYISGQFTTTTGNAVLIDALVPMIDASVLGPDTLAFDPGTLYTPNPFTKTLRIRNAGTADLRIDSVFLSYSDPLIAPLDPLQWNAGRILKPDSVLDINWRLQADRHEQATLVPLTFAVHHGGVLRSDVTASVFLPALVPGLEAEILGDTRLMYDAVVVYRPEPFKKTLRIRNSGTAGLLIDSIVVSWNDPDVQSVETARRDIGQTVSPGATLEEDWHFRAAPHASSMYAVLQFTLYHGGGIPLPLNTDIHIPGEPFAFRVIDVDIPDRIEARSDGQGYEGNPVVTQFAIENAAWFNAALQNAHVELVGDGVQMLSPQPRNDNLLISALNRSAALRDSFFVLPATYDRTIQVTISIESDRGISDRKQYDVFVPRISTNAVEGAPDIADFRLHGLYPNPLRAGSGQLHLDVESNGSLRIEIFDRLGRIIWTAAEISAQSGRRSVSLRIPILENGMYMLRIRSGGSQRMRPFVVLH